MRGIKPFYAARWETVEPEPEDQTLIAEPDDPTVEELMDIEDKFYEFKTDFSCKT